MLAAHPLVCSAGSRSAVAAALPQLKEDLIASLDDPSGDADAASVHECVRGAADRILSGMVRDSANAAATATPASMLASSDDESGGASTTGPDIVPGMPETKTREELADAIKTPCDAVSEARIIVDRRLANYKEARGR